MRCFEGFQTKLVFRLVLLAVIGFCLVPRLGVAQDAEVNGVAVAQGDPGDGLGVQIAPRWGAPSDGLGKHGDPGDGFEILGVYGDPGDGMDGRLPQIYGDPEDGLHFISGDPDDGLDFRYQVSDLGIACLLPEYWFFLMGIGIQ